MKFAGNFNTDLELDDIGYERTVIIGRRKVEYVIDMLPYGGNVKDAIQKDDEGHNGLSVEVALQQALRERYRTIIDINRMWLSLYCLYIKSSTYIGLMRSDAFRLDKQLVP